MESQNPAARWIDMWLGINFYGGKCMQHKNKYKTVFCCTCTCMKEQHAVSCEDCWKKKSIEDHKDHHYLQVRRASGRTAVEVGDITKHFSVSEIQTYSINKKDVVYLNPSNESLDKSKNCPYKCDLCKRKLILPKFKFCSIACKKEAVGLKYNDDVSKSRVVSKVDHRKRQVEETNTTTVMVPSSSSSPNEEQSSTKRPPKRRRKGIPVRSPFK